MPPDDQQDVAPDVERVSLLLRQLFAAASEDEVRNIFIQQQDVLLSDVAESLLRTTMEELQAGGDQEACIMIENILIFLHAAREMGVKAALALVVNTDAASDVVKQDQHDVAEDVLRSLLQEWLMISGVREQRHYLEQHLELLSLRTDELLLELIESCRASEDAEMQQQIWILRAFLAILQDVRARGGTSRAVLEAFINAGGGFACDLPPWLLELEQSGIAQARIGLAQPQALQRIELLQAALQRLDGEKSILPEVQAEVLLFLAQAQADIQIRRQLSLENAMLFYEAALQTFTRSLYPFQYARVQNERGMLYSQITTQERAVALEKAMACYEEALQVLSYASYPLQWADIQVNLGELYRQRLTGDQRENIEHAIDCYQKILAVQHPALPPRLCALAQLNSGVAYMTRIHGDRTSNYDLAIEYHEAALHFFTREAYPERWALLHSNLGECYRRRVTGQKNENISRAIACLEHAQQIWTRELYPLAWANVQCNLGLAYAEYQVQEQIVREENIQRAIAYQETAQEIYTRKAYPLEWARLEANKGKLYADRRGRWSEQIIKHYRASLEVYTPEATFGRWQLIQRIVAAAYLDYDAGERAENLMFARVFYEQWLFATMKNMFPAAHPSSVLLETCLHILAAQDVGLMELERLLPLYRHVIERLPAYDLDWLRVYHMFAVFLLDRFSDHGEQQDLVCAIALLEVIEPTLQGIEPTRCLIYADLAKGYLARWAIQRQQDDLERAIGRSKQALQTIPSSEVVFRAGLQNLLGQALLNYYTHTGNQEDLEQGIASLDQAYRIIPRSVLVLANISSALLARYVQTQQLADLERARQYVLSALELPAQDVREHVVALASASNVLLISYTRTGSLKELEQAITYCGEAIQQTTADDGDLPVYFLMLSRLLALHYERNAQGDDLERGITLCRASIQRFLPGSFAFFAAHQALVSVLLLHYGHLGEIKDIEEAIGLCRSVLPQLEQDTPLRAALLDGLGQALYVRSGHAQNQEDLASALVACREAVACGRVDAVDLPLYLVHLGMVLIMRYSYSGALVEVQEAGGLFRQAIQLFPQGSPFLLTAFAELSSILQVLYERTGDLALLEQAVVISRQAVQAVASHLVLLPQYLIRLGTALAFLYVHTGRYEHLEETIEIFERAFTLLPVNSPLIAQIALQMGNVLFARYQRTGSMEDLEQMITILRRQLLDLPPASHVRPNVYLVLAMGLQNRFERTAQVEDLEQALQYLRLATEQLAPHSPLGPRVLDTLGTVLMTRYHHNHDPQDLKFGFEVLGKAFLQTQQESPHWLPTATNLGSALLLYYQHTGELEYLERSLELISGAVERAQVGVPARPILLKLYARVHVLRFERTQMMDDLHEGFARYEQACQEGLQADLDLALSAGRDWGNYAWDQMLWDEAARAYAYALQAFEQLYREQFLFASQQTRLHASMSLYERAAYAHCRIGKLREAVLILEQGRARGLNDALALDQHVLDDIKRRQPDLYQRYMHVSGYMQRLRKNPSDMLPVQDKQRFPTIQLSVAGQLRHARVELEEIIEAIRLLPDHADFLAQPTYEQLAQAAQADIPLAYLAVTPAHSVVLLLQQGGTQPEYLEAVYNFDQQHRLFFKQNDAGEPSGGYLYGILGEIQSWLEESLHDALPRLGHELIAPLAVRLHQLQAKGVVLITMGMLDLWPLHAALYELDGHETSFGDNYIVTYAPSARVLLAARRIMYQRQMTAYPTCLVGIGNPLPGRIAAVEAQRGLQRLFPLMRDQIDRHLEQYKQLYDDLPEEAREQVERSPQDLEELWRKRLQQMQQLYVQEPELVRQADFQDLVQSFTTLEHVPAELVSTLKRLARSLTPGLVSAQGEAESIYQYFSADTASVLLLGEDATAAAVRKSLPEATLIHFAGHGMFDEHEPLESALLLAGGTRLTLQDLFSAEAALFDHVRLVTLSACRTAVGDFLDTPNEALSLLAGFLQAGAPAVIGTLWTVDDVCTALLMTRFYAFYLQGDETVAGNAARSLSLAQRWLRELSYEHLQQWLEQASEERKVHLATSLRLVLVPRVRRALRAGRGQEHPFANPYYWAAFVYYGAQEIG